MGRTTLAALLLGYLLPISQAEGLSIRHGGQRLATHAKSFLEIREQNLVRQGWDISCGAAALSTVLTYDFGAPYSEATIAVSILSNTDPDKVRERGGFSLLDLKRFADAVGYSAKGYGGLTLDDLASSTVPVILAVRIRDFDHFVVYRGRFAGRVLIGDPAFGNITLSEERFAQIWPSGTGFFVSQTNSDIWSDTSLTPEDMDLAVPDLNYVNRLSRSSSSRFTRKSMQAGLRP